MPCKGKKKKRKTSKRHKPISGTGGSFARGGGSMKKALKDLGKLKKRRKK